MTSFHSHSLSQFWVFALCKALWWFSLTADMKRGCTYHYQGSTSPASYWYCTLSAKKQTDAHFFWKEDMSETEPLANALKLHFHLLLWSMFLLFRRKLFWILFRGFVSSEWAFTFLFFLPNDLTHHSTRNSPLTSREVTDTVLSVFSINEWEPLFSQMWGLFEEVAPSHFGC